jgi:hypothetical protein
MPTALTVVLYPSKPGENSIPVLRTIRQDAEAAVFGLTFEDRTDRVVLTVGREAGVEFEGGYFEGEVLVLRKIGRGEFEPLLHEGGKRLVLQGSEVPLPDGP